MMANASTHHRVYLPGPHTNVLPTVIDHAPGCDGGDCNVVAGIAAWLASDDAERRVIRVEGEYFTTDGQTYERCQWQPSAILGRYWERRVNEQCAPPTREDEQ